MASSDERSRLLVALKQKANLQNKEWQSFQSKIQSTVDEMCSGMSASESARFQERISALCDDYSMWINSSSIQLIAKCKQSLQQTEQSEQTAVFGRRPLGVSGSTCTFSPTATEATTEDSESDFEVACEAIRIECVDCGKSFKKQRYLNEHIKNKVCRKLYECGDCGKRFESGNAWGGHRSATGHSLKSTQRAQRTQRTHTSTFSCDECGKVFKKRRYLMAHIKTVHQNIKRARLSLPIECADCGKIFGSAQAWGGHSSGTGHTIKLKVHIQKEAA